jgi:hypothetical protein
VLACSRFPGSHTGQRIAAKLELTLDFDIKQQIDYIITDNAANMKKTTTVVLYNIEDSKDGSVDVEADDAEAATDNTEKWQDIDETDQNIILETVNANCQRERPSCFDHILYLDVGDGLKDTECVSSALTKCCKISSMVHTSSLFSNAFEQAFGPNKSIPIFR